jgi:hypothetical protein
MRVFLLAILQSVMSLHKRISTAILHSRTVVFKYFGLQNLKATYFKTDFFYLYQN